MKLGGQTFWAGMDGLQKQDCIDARLYRDIDSSKAWPPKGLLLQKWREVLQIILRLVNEPGNNDYIFCKSAHPRVHLCELLLMGQKPVGANVKPTIVVFCRQKKYAKRMLYILQRSHCLSRLSLGFDYLAHDSLQRDIFRVAREAETGGSSPNLGYQDSLCGAAITVLSNDKDGVLKSRVATLGGIIEVNDQLYGMTTAHALLGSPTSSDSPPSSETDDSDQEADASDDDSENFEPIDPFQTALPREHTENIEALAYRVYLCPPTSGHSLQTRSASKLPGRLISTHMTDGNSIRPIISVMNNVALLPIADSQLPRTNLISTNEGVLQPAQLSRDPSEGPVIVASGVSGVRRTSMSGVLRGIILPNSKTMVPCIAVEGTSVEGDSGSWVVDPSTGDVQAMVVATSASANETYCVPMSAVLAGLEESNTDPLRISLPRVPDDDPTPAFHGANEELPPPAEDEDLAHGSPVVDRLPEVSNEAVSDEWPEESALPTNTERLTRDDHDATQLDDAQHQDINNSPVQYGVRPDLAKADLPPLELTSQLSASKAKSGVESGAVSVGSASTAPAALRGSAIAEQAELRINQHTPRSGGLRTMDGPPLVTPLKSSPAQNTSQTLSGDHDRPNPESLSIRTIPLPAGRSENPTKKKPAPSLVGRDSRSAPNSQTSRVESRSLLQEQRLSSSHHQSSHSEGLLTISRGSSRDDLLSRFGHGLEDRPRPPRQSQQSNTLRVHRDILFLETLEAWRLPWHLDPHDKMYVIIERLLNEELLEKLYRHTDMLRQRQENETDHNTHAPRHQDRMESHDIENESESSSTTTLIAPAATQNATEQRGVSGRERIRTRRAARRRNPSSGPALPGRGDDERPAQLVRHAWVDGRDVQRQKRQPSLEHGTRDHNAVDEHNPTGHVLPLTGLATEPSVVNRSLAWLVEQHHDQAFLSTLREIFYRNDLPHAVCDHLAEQFSQVQAARRAAVSGLASAGVPSNIPMNTIKKYDSRPERTGTPGSRSRGATLNYPAAEASNLRSHQGPQYLQQPTPIREPQSLGSSLLRYAATGLEPIPGSPMPTPTTTTTTTTLLTNPPQASATHSPADNPLDRVDTRSSSISNATTPKPRPFRNESIYDNATDGMILLIRGGRETISAAAFKHYSDIHWEYSTQNPNDIIVKPWISDRMVAQLMDYTQHYRDARIRARIRGDLDSGDEWEDKDGGAGKGGIDNGFGAGIGLGLRGGPAKRTKSVARRKSRWSAQPASLAARGNGNGNGNGSGVHSVKAAVAGAGQRREEKEAGRPRPRPQSFYG